MKPYRLTSDFFDRSTLTVAKELLGKFLVYKIGHKKIVGMITETEAYVGPNDLASHASRGRTQRTEIMFGPAGYAYVYLIYGVYHCFNIVTERDGYPAAVLIRAADIVSSGQFLVSRKIKSKTKLATSNYKLKTILNGPGKLCRYFQIDKTLNGENITKSKKLWLEDRGIGIKPSQIKRSPRVGIDYAGKYKNKPWRFYLKI